MGHTYKTPSFLIFNRKIIKLLREYQRAHSWLYSRSSFHWLAECDWTPARDLNAEEKGIGTHISDLFKFSPPTGFLTVRPLPPYSPLLHHVGSTLRDFCRIAGFHTPGFLLPVWSFFWPVEEKNLWWFFNFSIRSSIPNLDKRLRVAWNPPRSA
jgi:hypothetical protein